VELALTEGFDVGGLYVLGMAGVGIDPVDDHVLVERLTELALIVAVFAGGLTVERHVRRRSATPVTRWLLGSEAAAPER